MPNQKLRRIIGMSLFIAGVVVGLAFYASTVWADYEAQLFDSSLASDEAESTFRCPLIITNRETGTLHAVFGNPSNQHIIRRVRLHVTDGYVTLLREEDVLLSLAPGETQPLTWTVYPEDAAYRVLIMARVFAFRAYLQPARSSACGVLVLPLTFLSGAQLVVFVVTFSWLAMLAGNVLWRSGSRPLMGRSLSTAYAMIFLALVVAAGCLFSLVGWWLVGFFMVVLAVLLILALFRFAFAA